MEWKLTRNEHGYWVYCAQGLLYKRYFSLQEALDDMRILLNDEQNRISSLAEKLGEARAEKAALQGFVNSLEERP